MNILKSLIHAAGVIDTIIWKYLSQPEFFFFFPQLSVIYFNSLDDNVLEDVKTKLKNLNKGGIKRRFEIELISKNA